MTHTEPGISIDTLLSGRAESVRESLIRRVFEEARDVRDPINLTVGQPDFPVPEAIRRAASEAVLSNKNGYGSNRGWDPLLERIAAHLAWDLGWNVSTNVEGAALAKAGRTGLMITSGTSGGLLLAAMALLDPGDEIIIPDPYFVLYPRLGEFCDARVVCCDTYPDFRLTAERVEPLITPRTKMVVLSSPSNPCGVVNTERECRELLELCRRRGVLLVSDEIYDEFTYSECRTQPAPGDRSSLRCPSPCRKLAGEDGGEEETLLIRGFGKTYGITGWRLGYASGPAKLISRMIKLQSHVYICPPLPLQVGAEAALDVDMSAQVAAYQKRRDLVCARLSGVTDVAFPGGAFYAFVRVPERLKMTATQFKDAAKARRVLIVPGAAFSARDTHFRLSYACDEARLREGLDVLVELMKG